MVLGYDGHYLIQDVANGFKGKVDLLPLNKEKYISFTKHVENSEIKLKFIDSFKFMNSSLEKLAQNMNNLKIVKKGFPNVHPSRLNLLCRKQIYPYEYMDSRDKLLEEQLPSKINFFSSLSGEHITNKDYKHAQTVWREFKCQNLRDYTLLYMELDVRILADVFEEFCEKSMNAYGLDPSHYYTTPGLSFDAMLKYTGVELELLDDIDMLLFIERGVRGGISQCSNHYSKANNRYMNNYKKDNDEIFIMYFDINNLYGKAMEHFLPFGNFQWLRAKKMKNFDVMSIPNDSSKGYILEVDLDYPENLHESHKDLPFCSEHLKPPGSKEKKLLTTLYNKKNYVIHYMHLKQALENGLKLSKIHRVLEFDQKPWLKSYIDLNSQFRCSATSEFEKNFFKLMNNSIYGKTMENVRKRKHVKLINKWYGRYGAEAYISKPNFHSCTIFNKDLIAIEMEKLEIFMNKPIYVGMAILDISKTILYNFHYQFMKKTLNENCKLLYTDTDSGIYEIKSTNIYEIMKKNINRFDTSDYVENNVFQIPCMNKKIPGLMKDECQGRIVTEFIGLRSKMYCIMVENEDYAKKANGVKKNVIRNTISSADYRRCLFNNIEIYREQYNITSKYHELFTEKYNKLALKCYDDKRCSLENSFDTVPWGYKKI